MRVVVTGSASSLAGALLPLLAADSRITQLIGVDRREASFRHARFTQVLLDTRSPQLARLLAGADALIHLASTVFDGAPDERRGINLIGGQNVMRCAAQQRVPRIVHLSSAAVYALPARRHPIDEAHPRGGLPGFGLGEDQSALETWLDAFEQEHASLRLVRLRPHLVVGAHAPVLVRRLLRAPFTPRFAGAAPRLQCVHALDLARAVLLALEREVRGAFNLACADSATVRELQRAVGGGVLPLPLPLVYRWLRNRGSPEPAWTEALRHEIVLDTSRARRDLGWKPQYDSVRRCLEASD
ncbi:MAG TPA: NAD-dependent epimerase/dehydratase family protein [Burkholderiales bacterium]